MVIRTRQHLCAVLPRGEHRILEILRYPQEVKETREADFLRGGGKRRRCSEREIGMAGQLIEGMSEKRKPDKYRDTYYEDLKRRIEKKTTAGEAFVDGAGAPPLDGPQERAPDRSNPVGAFRRCAKIPGWRRP